MGPAVTSKKWIQVCESRVKTVALSKAQLYNSKGRTRPNKAQNPEANVVVGANRGANICRKQQTQREQNSRNSSVLACRSQDIVVFSVAKIAFFCEL